MPFTDIIGPGKFASGMLTYTDQFANDPNTRIVVPVTFENSVFTTAILDTGAPWCVLNPEEAEALNIDQRPDCVMSDRPLGIRGLTYQGILCRIPITFEAEHGAGIMLEATIFIPVLETGQKWPHPNFIGLDGLLDRIRFAIDPEHNHFYFGAV